MRNISDTVMLIIGYTLPFISLPFLFWIIYDKRSILFILTAVLSCIATPLVILTVLQFQYLEEYKQHHENYTFETKQNYELVTSAKKHPFIYKDNGYTFLVKTDDHSKITKVENINSKEIKFETTTKKSYVTKEVYTLNEPFYEKYFSLLPFMKIEEQKLEMYKIYLNEGK